MKNIVLSSYNNNIIGNASGKGNSTIMNTSESIDKLKKPLLKKTFQKTRNASVNGHSYTENKINGLRKISAIRNASISIPSTMTKENNQSINNQSLNNHTISNENKYSMGKFTKNFIYKPIQTTNTEFKREKSRVDKSPIRLASFDGEFNHNTNSKLKIPPIIPEQILNTLDMIESRRTQEKSGKTNYTPQNIVIISNAKSKDNYLQNHALSAKKNGLKYISRKPDINSIEKVEADKKNTISNTIKKGTNVHIVKNLFKKK